MLFLAMKIVVESCGGAARLALVKLKETKEQHDQEGTRQVRDR